MKRLPVLAAVAAVCALTATHAVAATKPKVKPPTPVTQTLYFHGTQANGNVDQNPANGSNMPMDATKPTGSSDKQIAFWGAATTPNVQCSGNKLVPTWTGPVTGTLVGKATVSFYAESTPSAKAVVQVFADVAGECNASYIEPLGQVTVDLPASPTATLVTAVVPITGKGGGKTVGKVNSSLLVQIIPAPGTGGNGPQLSGVSYDSSTSPSSVTFSCLPKTGKKTC